ncbi:MULTISPECIES: HlyD family efflux transporter periplasmic adaptor subunit [Pseudoxanthomonas]|uniref:HlyD family secretion protein n=1 Tax=Pseudoxanthomonas TaxID=83618 RepID=UPI0016210FDD|nr:MULTISPECIES: HlyD family efflux transporter periplasmic adaptor subunit [Pseudoxanthomonas]MBB3276698.1 multidrug resistance efflux pump [Pseudoxanthomonas sp. OG2]MBD9378762.1 HlyD family efflux transporter periplasmic adaptor subunit [Pseudoxanthomonas sp. PXM04]MBV7472229.1 HlyD family efflux transporter periplasmic adaptor subunit [Pseudoxanthomonas sp. PXM05]
MKPARFNSPRGALFALALACALPATHAATLRVDGEVYAQRSSQLIPPSVDRMWQFNITQLAPDGSSVKKGDVVVAFDTSDLVRQLSEKQSLLQEKKRTLENLSLDLAERERSQRLTTAEAEAKHDKARRKTEQPRELIAALEYDKLVEERRRTERLAALAQVAERAAAEQRKQELRLVNSELQQAQADVTRLQSSIAALNLPAPRDGVIMHKSSWNGEKFDVGSQVWRGQTVAEIPDPTTLAVRAQLPERDLQRVKVGVPARIVIEGGGGSVHHGKVASIGRAVRSKSQVQPVPILDLEIRLDDARAKLRPGQAVRVELTVPDVAGGAK